ncbi:TetR family transcriptional regulator [Massilia sp. BSC265]|nr:TetR family transcriptional regulator [Massilia sp. BSC265]
MKNRSPSVERICAAAVAHFAEFGYDGSSLNDIAEQVGIRKASLYAHFSGKDALFLEVYSDALEKETEFVHACFAIEGAYGTGEQYCRMIARRYADSVYLRYLLRTAFLPPAVLRDAVVQGYEGFMQVLRDLFCTGLAHRFMLEAKEVSVYADAYLGIVDSLHVELVYASEAAFERRRAALWRILSDSLAQAPVARQGA